MGMTESAVAVSLARAASAAGANCCIEIDPGRKVVAALEVGVFGYGYGRGRELGRQWRRPRESGARGICSLPDGPAAAVCVRGRTPVEDGGGLLDGVERESGRSAGRSCPAARALEDFAEGGGHGGKVFQGWEDERARLVAALRQGATQAAGAVGEVGVAVLAARQGRTAAVGSVFFNVVTSFVIAFGQIPFRWGRYPLPHP